MKKYIISIILFIITSNIYGANGYLVNKSKVSEIDEHGICKKVKVNDANTYFVPTKFKVEWQSFLNHTPKDIGLSECESFDYVFPLDFSRTMNEYEDNPLNENGDKYYCGMFNADTFPNLDSMAVITPEGRVKCWGGSCAGAPTDSGYTKIFSSSSAFVAMKADGSITTWGNPSNGGSGAPSNIGLNAKVYSNRYAFAVLKSDGRIISWGRSAGGGTGAPTDSGYIKVYSGAYAFAALKKDGSIVTWDGRGNDISGIKRYTPTDSGYIKIYSNLISFTALKADGSIKSWGYGPAWEANIVLSALNNNSACKNKNNLPPTDNGYTKICSTSTSYTALKQDGSIKSWGNPYTGGVCSPSGSGYTKIYSTNLAFAATKGSGDFVFWGGRSVEDTLGRIFNTWPQPASAGEHLNFRTYFVKSDSVVGISKIYLSGDKVWGIKQGNVDTNNLVTWEGYSFPGSPGGNPKFDFLPSTSNILKGFTSIYPAFNGNYYYSKTNKNNNLLENGSEFEKIFIGWSDIKKTYTTFDSIIGIKQNGDIKCIGGQLCQLLPKNINS